ncbi:hypothetical protein [Kitasatospora sp. NPDC093679]|uniref:hypothetical protein n=1 Tax=Kitasatospora sp. NPDC093679 TaxID=3154983 RepID=UPI0034178851
MGVLKTPNGNIVGYRLNGRDHPITMANAQRAVQVINCWRRRGGPTVSNFTAFELERFSDETGLDLFGREIRLIARGIYFYVTGRADAVRAARTITADQAPRPLVKRPGARAYEALRGAQKHYEATRGIEEEAALTIRRARTDLARAAGPLGQDEAQRILAKAVSHAEAAIQAARAVKAEFLAACDTYDRGCEAARTLKVGEVARSAESVAYSAARVRELAEAARAALYAAQRAQGKLRSEAERRSGRPGRPRFSDPLGG